MFLIRLLSASVGLGLLATAVIHGQPPRAFVVAHRGASFYAPEHTIPAYRLALEQGADDVEQDIVITKDGVLVRGKAGICPELKNPGRLRSKGIDPEQAVAAALTTNGLVGATVRGRPAVHLQVFEEESVRRLASLLPAVPRSFLIGSASMAEGWLSDSGLDEVKTFATGVAPSRTLVDGLFTDNPDLFPR